MQNKEYKAYAYGKINLYLDVLNKRKDGYHNIRSVMQTVSQHDTVTLTVAPSVENKIEISCSDPNIKCDSSNLVYKAARLFIEKYRGECADFKFYIEKNIPVSAGMAGGSADAAATLKLLNEAYSYPFSEDELCNMGRAIGADVPFCIKGGTCICEGIGEKLTRLPTFSGYYIVTAIDSSSVSTPEAFAMLDEIFGTECTDSSCIDKMIEAIRNKDIDGVCSSLYNKFECAIIPQNKGVKLIKDSFLGLDAMGALMSGSGPSVFAIFSDEKLARNAAEYLEVFEIRANVCKTI